MDLGRRKKLQKHQRGGNRAVASSGGVGRVVSSGSGGDTKRHNNMTCRKGNNNVMTIVQEKLKHIELGVSLLHSPSSYLLFLTSVSLNVLFRQILGTAKEIAAVSVVSVITLDVT